MKKVVFVSDLCCERCARRLAEKLELSGSVLKAKANHKRNSIFVEVKSEVSDETLKTLSVGEVYEVLSIAQRKGLFC